MTQRDPYAVKNVLPLRQNNPYSAGTKVFTMYTAPTRTMSYYDEDVSQPTSDKSNTPTSIRSDEDYQAVPELVSSLTSSPSQPQTAADTTKAPQALQYVRYPYRSDLSELVLQRVPQELLKEGAAWLDVFVLEFIREQLTSLTQGDELFRNRTGYSELKIFKYSREKNYRTCYIHKDTHDLRFLVRDDHAEWWVEKFNRTRFSFDTITRRMMIGEEAASGTPLELVIQSRKHNVKPTETTLPLPKA